jgi:hypothetical protein
LYAAADPGERVDALAWQRGVGPANAGKLSRAGRLGTDAFGSGQVRNLDGGEGGFEENASDVRANPQPEQPFRPVDVGGDGEAARGFDNPCRLREIRGGVDVEAAPLA